MGQSFADSAIYNVENENLQFTEPTGGLLIIGRKFCGLTLKYLKMNWRLVTKPHTASTIHFFPSRLPQCCASEQVDKPPPEKRKGAPSIPRTSLTSMSIDIQRHCIAANAAMSLSEDEK